VYLKFGIALLGATGWHDEYDLTLKVYNAAAEMEMCNANYEGMKSIVESVVRHSRREDDTILAKTTLIHGLLVNNQQQQGLDLGRELLSRLGFGLPKRFNSLYFWWEMTSIQRMLRGKSNEYLKRLPFISDEKVLASMHILNLVCTSKL
jgi:predicted ATPase